MWFLIVLVIVVVVIIIFYTKNKKKKAYEAFITSAGREVAFQIKDELIQNGYNVGNFIEMYEFGNYTGSFSVSSDSEKGIIWACADPSVFNFFGSEMIEKNMKAVNGYFHVIENSNIGLFISSEKESIEIPSFMLIAADIIKRSRYKFKHPDWFNEDPKAKKYLNVMF